MKLMLYLFTVANLAGLFLYTHFVRAIQQMMQMEERDYSDFGDNVEFMCTALPVLVICLLLNFVWGSMGLRDAAQFRGWRSFASCAVIVVVWVTTILMVRRFP